MAKLLDFEFAGATDAKSVEGGVGGTPSTANLQGDAALDGAGSVWFDGAGDHVEIPPDAAFGLAEGTIAIDFTQYAVSAGNDIYTGQTLLSVDSMHFDGGGHLTIFIRADGQISVRHQDEMSQTYMTGGSIEVGTPATMAYSWGPEGSRLLVDGVEVASSPNAYVLAGDVEPIVLGAAQNRSGDGVADNMRAYFDGEMSRVQLFDEATPASGQIPCFGAGAMIQTPDGPRPVETLAPGDAVLSHSANTITVRHVFHSHVNESAMAACPNRRPVRIPAGVLGAHRDLFLSRQHGVLVNGPGGPRLVRAVQLERFGPGPVRTARGKACIHYVHLLTDPHAVIWANGVPCETLLPGPAVRHWLGLTKAHELMTPVKPCHPYAQGPWCRAVFAPNRGRTPIPA
ncbi:MAG: Hint domain-containing protein [Pseudomonadota bacterium]